VSQQQLCRPLSCFHDRIVDQDDPTAVRARISAGERHGFGALGTVARSTSVVPSSTAGSLGYIGALRLLGSLHHHGTLLGRGSYLARNSSATKCVIGQGSVRWPQ